MLRMLLEKLKVWITSMMFFFDCVDTDCLGNHNGMLWNIRENG
jgi:hypothetical protein